MRFWQTGLKLAQKSNVKNIALAGAWSNTLLRKLCKERAERQTWVLLPPPVYVRITLL